MVFSPLVRRIGFGSPSAEQRAVEIEVGVTNRSHKRRAKAPLGLSVGAFEA